MSGCQEAGSFTPFVLINTVIVIFLFPLPPFLLFHVFFFFLCLCRTGFSQLCSPRRAFSEQGPLRLIKSASFFSGWRFKLATTETCQLHVCGRAVDAIEWVCVGFGWQQLHACGDRGTGERNSRHVISKHGCRGLGSDGCGRKKEKNTF